MKNKAYGYRPLVYICSPFAGDFEHNIQRARHISRFAVEEGALDWYFYPDANRLERHFFIPVRSLDNHYHGSVHRLECYLLHHFRPMDGPHDHGHRGLEHGLHQHSKRR